MDNVDPNTVGRPFQGGYPTKLLEGRLGGRIRRSALPRCRNILGPDDGHPTTDR